MKFLALDIETTGINVKRSQILQISAVFHDTHTNVERVFDVLVDNGPIVYGEPYALKLNSWIFDELSKKSGAHKILSLGTAQFEFKRFVEECCEGKITVAGKNVAGFDLRILETNGFFLDKFSHRVLDVGTLYLTDFGYIPTLGEINKRLDRPQVSHNALEDCRDVIAAIEAKLVG